MPTCTRLTIREGVTLYWNSTEKPFHSPGRLPCGRGFCYSTDMTHADLMAGYYAAREAQETQAEAEACGYSTELAEFYERNPRLTFRRYLEQMRGR